ncbi:MAG TPA: penicillin-binding transpeptidase domain-containing protein [Flavipsychrobacter sp.]|nr:penicillin-binding transpeptidase domain-containing protein [Flavipsychrobacter sp.]
MRTSFILSFVSIVFLSSCAKTRIKEHSDWGEYFTANGIKNGCFILRDNNHESVHYYNKDRCTQRLLPASTFKIFNSLAALETAVAPDDQLVIKWDGVKRKPEWDKDLTMREAFAVSCVPYYQELARRIGRSSMQHYMDTVKYGNMKIGPHIDSFWLDNSLQITADEQVGFLKQLYFNQLPLSERSQRIVRSMMLREDSTGYKLYYKTGWGNVGDRSTLWLVGFVERIEHVNEPKESMNKSDVRMYPYFFAENFDIDKSDTTKDWSKIRLQIAKEILRNYGAM